VFSYLNQFYDQICVPKISTIHRQRLSIFSQFFGENISKFVAFIDPRSASTASSSSSGSSATSSSCTPSSPRGTCAPRETTSSSTWDRFYESPFRP
jgi:hypothetical protein